VHQVVSHCPADACGVVPHCRAQVSELLSVGQDARSEADSLRQQLKSRDLEVEHMTLALAGQQLWLNQCLPSKLSCKHMQSCLFGLLQCYKQSGCVSVCAFAK
jgi:hypothetical protein